MTFNMQMALWAAKQYAFYHASVGKRNKILVGVQDIESALPSTPPCDGTVHDSVCGCGCNSQPDKLDPPDQFSMF